MQSVSWFGVINQYRMFDSGDFSGFELTFQSSIVKNYIITSNKEHDWTPIK